MYLRGYQQSSYGVVLAYEVYGLLGLSGLWDSVARELGGVVTLGARRTMDAGSTSSRGSMLLGGTMVWRVCLRMSYHPCCYPRSGW